MDHRYRKFLMLAEYGSFSQAAKILRVTQPAITLAVHSLERAFGCRLYVRGSREFQLTDEGAIVAVSARKIADEIARMERELATTKKPGQIKLGIVDSIAQLLYSSPAAGMLVREFDVKVDNSRRILQSMTASRMDFGLITGQLQPIDRALSVLDQFEEEFVFVHAPDYASADAAVIDWLAFNEDSTTYRYFVKQFKQRALRFRPIFHATSMELLRDMAASGKGVALLPQHAVRDYLDSGKLVRASLPAIKRPIWIVGRQARLSPGLRAIAQQLAQLTA